MLADKTCVTSRAGVIWVNCFDHGDMTQPFGGYKLSGQGCDKCVESLISYTQINLD
jgi:gamma-glutamyl-gamma-aminobutyraldehyde dehydrogenase